MLTGLLKLGGQALSDQRVLLISGDMMKLLGSVTTGKDGAFEVVVPHEHKNGEVILLIKIQGPVIALVHKVVDLKSDGKGPHLINIESSKGEYHQIHGMIETTSGWPPFLNVFVDPVHIAGIPAQLEKFFNQRDEKVVESSFFKKRLEDKSFILKLKSGTYRIGGDYLNYSRPNMVNPDFENYLVARVDADGENKPLEGKRYGGYLLEVKRNREITMTIEVVPDEELNR